MPEDPTPTWLELERILPLKDAANVSSLSEDSLKRNHADKIIRLGPRRLGMRAGDALMLGKQFLVVMFVMVTVALVARAAAASSTMHHKIDDRTIFRFTAEIAGLAHQADPQEVPTPSVPVRRASDSCPIRASCRSLHREADRRRRAPTRQGERLSTHPRSCTRLPQGLMQRARVSHTRIGIADTRIDDGYHAKKHAEPHSVA
jgi:hypothetical protein